MPSIYSEDNDEMENEHFTKRLALSSWLIKRNPGLCDYRLQLRPLPLNSALCNYGKINERKKNHVRFDRAFFSRSS